MINEIEPARQSTSSQVEVLRKTASLRTAAPARLAMNQMTTYRWSFQEDVTAYVDVGLQGIGIWRPKLVEFGEERGIDLIHETNLGVSSLSWAGGFTGANGHTYDEALDDALDALDVAAQLGADCLVVISGSRGGHTSNHARRLLIDALRCLADEAGQRGLTLAVEPMYRIFAPEWTFLTTLDDTLDILDRCNHPAVKMAFDVYHLWQEKRLVSRIADVAPYVAVVQLSDWRNFPRSDADRALPGDGDIPLADILQAFEDASYSGFFEVEVWSEEVWCSDYETLLRRCRKRFDSYCRRH